MRGSSHWALEGDLQRSGTNPQLIDSIVAERQFLFRTEPQRGTRALQKHMLAYARSRLLILVTGRPRGSLFQGAVLLGKDGLFQHRL